MPFLAEMGNRQYSIPGGMADPSTTWEEANADVDVGSPLPPKNSQHPLFYGAPLIL